MSQERVQKRYRRTLVGALSALVVVLVFFLWPRPPFAFLRWQAPVTTNDETFSNMKVLDRTYAFRADFDELHKRVTQELIAQGFVLTTDDRFNVDDRRVIRYQRSTIDAFGNRYDDFVTLSPNWHYVLSDIGEAPSVIGYGHPGWVSLAIRVERPLNQVDIAMVKIRQWLGLRVMTVTKHQL